MRNILKDLSLFLCIFLISFSVRAITEKLSAADFLSMPDMVDAEISPNGQYLAMITKHQKGRKITIHDLNKKGSPVIGAVRDEVLYPLSIDWVSNERMVVRLFIPFYFNDVAQDAKENEEYDIRNYSGYRRSISIDKHGKNIVTLLEDKTVFRKTTDGSVIDNYLINDSKHILMAAEHGRSLYKINIYTGKSELHIRGARRTIRFVTDEDGEPLYRLDYYYYAKTTKIFKKVKDEWEYVFEIDYNEEEDGKLKTEGLKLVTFGEENELVYRKRNEKTGYFSIVAINVKTGIQRTLAEDDNNDISFMISSKKSDKFIGYAVEKDLIRVHYLDPEKQITYDKTAKLVGDYNFGYRQSYDASKRYVISSYGQDRPGTFHIYDEEKNKLYFLAEYSKKLSQDNLSLPARATYLTRDKVKIRMYVLFPPNYDSNKSYPMVLMPHGGPHARDSATYDEFAQFVSTRGYIVIQPNFRGSSGEGLEFERAGYKQWGKLMQDDLVDSVSYMVRKGMANPDKICIVGGSYGGYAALIGAIKNTDIFKCAISINGVTHLIEQIEYNIDETKHEEIVTKRLHERIGDPDKDEADLNANSPALMPELVKIPVFIIAGDEDQIVPFEQAEMMAEGLEKRNELTHDFLVIEGAGHHIFEDDSNRKTIYEEVEKFLARFLD